jgi:hypothetical protein
MVLTISAVLILTFTLGLFSAVILLVFPGIAGILMLFNICFKHIMEKY